jgi:hypothetical protein
MVPTYYRLKKLERFVVSAQKCCGRGNICFTFCVNKKDNDTVLLINTLCRGWEYQILYEDLPEPNLANFYNLMYRQSRFNNPETIVTMLGDDMEFRTNGADTFFINEINKHGGMGIFYGNDKNKKKKLCTMLFTTRKFIDYNLPEPFMNELFPVDVIDRLWRDTAEKLNCLYYYPQIKILHHHSKKDRDATHVRLRTQAYITRANETAYPFILAAQIERMYKAINPVVEPEPVIEPLAKTVLFALMGRYGDIISGSFIANMLIDAGFKVKWFTKPYYEELVKVVCEEAEVLCIDSKSDWEETTAHEMRIKHFGYDHYINAQLGSKENFNNFMKLDTSPQGYMKKIAEEATGNKLSNDYLRYAKLKPLKRVNIERNKPLAIIAPETRSVMPAMSQTVVEENYERYKNEYCVKILVEKEPKEQDDRYLYGYTFVECVSLLQQASLFISNDSGLAWAALYNSLCKKIIYHQKKRVEKINLLYKELEPGAEDKILDTHTKEEELEYKRKRRKWLLSIREAASVTSCSSTQ